LTDHSAIGVNDAVYIFGGADANGTVLNQVLKYDPTLHTYTAMAPMPTPRYRMGATLFDSKFYDFALFRNVLIQSSCYNFALFLPRLPELNRSVPYSDF